MNNNEKQEKNDTVNLALHLKNMAGLQPYEKAVIFPAGRDTKGRVAYTHLTFRQLDQESDCLAHGLKNAGITRGTRTILMVKPSLDFFCLTFALIKTGAVPVMVDPGMGISRMLDCLKEGDPQAFIGIPKAHVLRIFYPRFFKTVKTWITVGKRWFWGGLTLKHIRQAPWRPYTIAATGKDETAAIMFTTGSTGPAKGVVYTHGTFDAQVSNIKSHFKIKPGEIDLPTFPLFAIFDPALGITAVIPDMNPTKPARVKPEKIIEAILNHGVTNMFGSPALLRRVGRFGRDKGVKLPSLIRVISAGAPVLTSVIEEFETMLNDDAEIHTPYGATEAFPTISIASREILFETSDKSAQGFGTCVGRPIDSIEVRLITINDKPILNWSDALMVDQGEIGEITVRGDLVTGNYFKRPRDDSLAKIKDGDTIWHRMGDLGWEDKNGRIWFCGRKSHRVITREKTLFTIPSEAIFNNHPKVFRSALVGVGPAKKQKPVVCIELEKGNWTSKKRILLELRELAKNNEQTKDLDTILFHKAFPVDIRHNSKIFREKLSLWAHHRLKKQHR
jgi:acyl-CoA synthetase (AMP-forming)/AMP-acid ligase II